MWGENFLQQSTRPYIDILKVHILLSVFDQLIVSVGRIRIQIHLRVAVDVDDAFCIALGDCSLGCAELDCIPGYASGTILCAAADADIPAVVVNGHIAIEIADLTVHFHIGNSSIFKLAIVIDFVYQPGLVGCRQGGIALNLLLHLLLLGICQGDGTFRGTGEGVIHQKVCRLSVGYAVDFTEVRSGLAADIDGVNLCVPWITRRNDVINTIVDNLAALFSHEDIVQLQVGVRIVFDSDAGGGIGAKRSSPRAGEIIGRYVDIAAAGSNIRNLHIIDGTARVGINVVAVSILIRQPQAFHIRLDSFAFRDIGRHHLCAAIILVISVIGSNQVVQFRQPCSQGIGIIKGSLGNASLHPVVGLVVGRRYGQPLCDAAADGQIDGISGAGNKGAGHVYRAGFWHGLIRRNRIGGQEGLIGAGAAQGPVPEALVF